MATIDSNLPLSYDTELNPRSGKKTQVFDDLSYHVESLSDNEIVAGQIVFTPLTDSERDTVMTFYTTNKNLAFDFVNPNDGNTYTLYFQDPPPKSQAISGWKPLKYRVVYQVVGE